MSIQLKPFYRGDDFALEVVLKNKEAQTPVDIIGWVLTSTMKLSSEMPDSPELDDEGYRQVLQITHVVLDNEDAKSGKTRLLFPHEQTAELLATTYQIDIQAEVGDSVTTLMKGSVEVLSDVTRKTYEPAPDIKLIKTS